MLPKTARRVGQASKLHSDSLRDGAMNITKQVFEYCDLRRHLWNQHFAPKVEGLMDQRIDAFLEIQKLLFRSIVLAECGMADYEFGAFGTDPIGFIEARISDDLEQLDILEAESAHPTAWKKRTITKCDWVEHKLKFVEFFDWYPQDPQGRCSYSQVEVRTSSENLRGSRRWVIPVESVSFEAESKVPGSK